MKLQIETGVYNEKRYSRPWIARVTFEAAKGEFAFGEWAGRDGHAGLLILDAEPGDIVARGQKDFRKPSNSAPDFFVVQDDGTLEPIGKAAAYKHWQERQAAPAATEPAVSSIDALRALVSVIDAGTSADYRALQETEAMRVAREVLGGAA